MHWKLRSFGREYISMICAQIRRIRSEMCIRDRDYMKTAKAKGLSEKETVWRHQLRNAMIPIVTGLGPAVASTLMGSFIVEQLFSIPGIGKHFTESVQALDYTMVLGLTIFFGIFLVAANFIVDILYGIIDPRIRITD